MTKATEAKETEEAAKAQAQVIPPKDWASGAELLADGQDRLYYKCDRGNVCTGYLQGESSFEDGDGRMVEYFVFHTDREVLVTSGEKKDPFPAPKGSIVYVNKRAQLHSLEEYMGTDEVVWAGLEPVSKKAIKGGRTVWNFRLAIKATGRKRPKMALGSGPIKARVASNGEDSDIPF